MPKHINLLVTGGCGFIGRHFIELATKSKDIDFIVNIDKLTYAAADSPEYGTEKETLITEYGLFIQGDINNTDLIKSILVKYDIHAVINFAAETHVDNSIESNDPFIYSNVLGTYSLLEAIKTIWGDRNDCKYIQVSTDEVYGHLAPKDPAFDEETPYNPRNPYSASKAAGDQMVMAYGNTYDINVVVSHCSNNYGPYQHEEKLIPKTIRRALAGEKIPVYGDGQQVRDWIYVTDHAEAILTLLVGGCLPLGKHYNIGASNEIKNINLVNTICDILEERIGKPFHKQIEFVKDRLGHDRRYAINSGRMHKDFGWTPKTTFEKGLEKTVDYYLNKWYVKT